MKREHLMSVAHGRCDLGEIIRDVLLLVGPGLGRHGTTLEMLLAPDLPPVMGDRVQLQQVLLKLLLNAAEAVRDVLPAPRTSGATAAFVVDEQDCNRADGEDWRWPR